MDRCTGNRNTAEILLKKALNTTQSINKPFPKRQILDSSKLKEFADNNFILNENGRKFSKRLVENAGKSRKWSFTAILPTPVVNVG